MPLIKSNGTNETWKPVAENSAEIVREKEEYKVPTDPKDKRIQRSGLYQAALMSVGIVQHSSGSFEDYLANVEKAVEAGLRFVNK